MDKCKKERILKYFLLASILCLVVFFPVQAFSQTETGSLEITVKYTNHERATHPEPARLSALAAQRRGATGVGTDPRQVPGERSQGTLSGHRGSGSGPAETTRDDGNRSASLRRCGEALAEVATRTSRGCGHGVTHCDSVIFRPLAGRGMA